jgi:hypothetical protein
MSVQVRLAELAEQLERFRFAYLATVGADQRCHLVAVRPTLEGSALLVPEPGRTTRRNLALHPGVSLVWPPADPTGHSLIVDGDGALRDGVMVVSPTRAVLHRTGPDPGPDPGGGCAADCLELPVRGGTAPSTRSAP